jgi:hypothetical protein
VEPDDLINNARYILGKIEEAAASVDLTLPDRRYVTVGGSVYDCEQVTVSAMTAQTGIVSPEADALQVIGPCPPTWNVTYEAGIVLCAHEKVRGPRGELPPKVEDVELDTMSMSKAYAALVNAVDLISSEGVVGRMTANVQFGQPQGALIAAVATISTNLWFVPPPGP